MGNMNEFRCLMCKRSVFVWWPGARLCAGCLVRLRSAVARVFLARWYGRTAPPPPCPAPELHDGNALGCYTCFTSALIARDFQQPSRAPNDTGRPELREDST